MGVNHELSELLFGGHQEFNYHFMNKKLLLVSLDELKTYTFNYEKNGSGIDLTWDHLHFVSLQLASSDQIAKSTSQNFPKN